MRPSFVRVLDSTVGQKIITAATGLGLAGFVVAHMLGNLQLFVGQEAINAYAKKLQSLGVLLWLARIGLLALIATHIAMTIRLALRNRRASHQKQPQRSGLGSDRYSQRSCSASTRSSRTMAISGSLILAFLIFHLAHFTFGWIQPELHELTDAQGRHDVYTMVVAGFRNPTIVAVYLVGLMFLLGHLSHALFSAFQTLGVAYGRQKQRARKLARVAAIVIIAGFGAIPLASVFGWIGQ